VQPLTLFTAVHNEGSAASRAISPVYDALASQLSRPNVMTFTKVNVEQQKQIVESYNITK